MPSVYLEPERLASPDSLTALLLERAGIDEDLFADGWVGAHGAQPSAPTGRASSLTAEYFECAGTGAERRLQAVLDGSGLAVTTGQQPQLFGGPLYVLYKALTAVRIAAELETKVGAPCLAVFWVASDDHDWREIGSASLLDSEETIRRFAVPEPPGSGRRPVGPSQLPPEIADVAVDFCAHLETRPEGARWTSLVAEAYRPGDTFARSFMDVLRAWIGDLPMAFLDSAQPALRRAAVPLVRRVLEQHPAIEVALSRGIERVEKTEHVPQLAFLAGASPVFRDDGEGRHRLYHESNGFRMGKAGNEMPTADLLAELEAFPERFSPSAALRPVVESYVLPVAATVLGPGEIAYWAQLPPLFEALQVDMPLVAPRTAWRVVEPRMARLLEKTGISADELRDGGADAEAALVERSRPRRVESALLRLEEVAVEGFGALDDAAEDEMPGLRSAVGKTRSQVFSALAGFRKTLDSGTRQKHQVAVGQVRRAARNLYPGGISQERVVSPFVYLARYGDAFLADVRAAHQPGAAHE